MRSLRYANQTRGFILNRPQEAQILHVDGKRDKVYKYDHQQLEKYCDDLELKYKALSAMFGQYSKISNSDIEGALNNKEE